MTLNLGFINAALENRAFLLGNDFSAADTHRKVIDRQVGAERLRNVANLNKIFFAHLTVASARHFREIFSSPFTNACNNRFRITRKKVHAST